MSTGLTTSLTLDSKR